MGTVLLAPCAYLWVCKATFLFSFSWSPTSSWLGGSVTSDGEQLTVELIVIKIVNKGAIKVNAEMNSRPRFRRKVQRLSSKGEGGGNARAHTHTEGWNST